MSAGSMYSTPLNMPFVVRDNRAFRNLSMRPIQSKGSKITTCPAVLVLNKDHHHRRETRKRLAVRKAMREEYVRSSSRKDFDPRRSRIHKHHKSTCKNSRKHGDDAK
jgi:hypothetical protein